MAAWRPTPAGIANLVHLLYGSQPGYDQGLRHLTRAAERQLGAFSPPELLSFTSGLAQCDRLGPSEEPRWS